MNKIKFLGLAIAVILLLFGAFILGKKMSNSRLETYNRQLEGNLTEKEKKLESLNKDLGIAQSDLMTAKELNEHLKKDNKEKDAKFDAFVKEHNLQIASRDNTIAELKQKISGGESSVVIVSPSNDFSCSDLSKKCIVQYNWQDTLKRFKLTDPNIFEENNEIFESAQIFRVYGEVYQQKDGFLETRRIVLREVHKKSDGTYEEIPGGKADIVDSQFQYTNPPKSEEQSIFHPRMIASADVNLIPDIGRTKFGLGAELLSLFGVGLSTNLAADFQQLKNSEINIGIEYTPKFSNLDLNVGIGVFGGTPFDSFFKEFNLSIGLIFYITN